VLDEERDVLAPRPERRHLDDGRGEPVVHVLAEGALLHGRLEVPVGRRGDPDGRLHAPRGADRPALPLLEEPEEHRLGARGELPDLVREERAAREGRDEPRLPAHRPGEGTPLVAEELAPEELAREGGAAEGLEGAGAAAAQALDGRGHELLAGARLPADQDGPVPGPYFSDLPEERPHRRAPPDDPVRALRRHEIDRMVEKVRRGRAELPPWVFWTDEGTPLDESRVRKAFSQALRRAKLPAFRVYDLRHTYASLLLAQGAPITYVSAQLGHTDATTTLRWYARWIHRTDKRAVDALDDARPVSTVRLEAARGGTVGDQSASGKPNRAPR
jgi:hypothetical protein